MGSWIALISATIEDCFCAQVGRKNRFVCGRGARGKAAAGLPHSKNGPFQVEAATAARTRWPPERWPLQRNEERPRDKPAATKGKARQNAKNRARIKKRQNARSKPRNKPRYKSRSK